MIIGIDEVGRWPLAGPVGVWAVVCLPSFLDDLPSRYSDIKDSKKLTFWQRERLAWLIKNHPHLVYATSLISAKIIDTHGIVAAIRKASWEVIEEIRMKIESIDCHFGFDPESVTSGRNSESSSEWHGFVKILLDGRTDYWLRKEFPWYEIETIVKWDQKVREISAASIIAKVQRDQYMINLSHRKKYRDYGFDRHKGYGTLIHRNTIVQYGLSDQHRKTFCTRFIRL